MTTPAVSGVEKEHTKVCEAATAAVLTPQFATEAPTAQEAAVLEGAEQVPEGPAAEGLPIVVVNAPAVARYCD